MERQTFRDAHILGAGLSLAEIQAWQSEHPIHQLPPDLVAFLQRVNGVHFWADLKRGRAYFGIAPLHEWQDAATGDWSSYFDSFESPPKAQLVISYHDNGDNFLILDTLKVEYRWHDPYDFDNPTIVARSVEELLDCWWRETDWLDPRKLGGAINPRVETG